MLAEIQQINNKLLESEQAFGLIWDRLTAKMTINTGVKFISLVPQCYVNSTVATNKRMLSTIAVIDPELNVRQQSLVLEYSGNDFVGAELWDNSSTVKSDTTDVFDEGIDKSGPTTEAFVSLDVEFSNVSWNPITKQITCDITIKFKLFGFITLKVVTFTGVTFP